MLYFLLRYFDLPMAFTYTSTRMALAASTSLILSVLCGPWFILQLYRWKIGQPIRKEECPLLGQLHEKKQDTPTMGGILILFSMIVSLLLWMDWTSPFTLILLLTTLCLGALGAYDDFSKLRSRSSRGLAGKKKFFIQVLLSLLLAFYLLYSPFAEWIHRGAWFAPPIARAGGEVFSLSDYTSMLYLPFFKTPVLMVSGVATFFFAFWIAFVITGASNAVNLTDGLDGLAAGTLIMAGGVMAFVAFVSNHLEIARYLNILYIEGSGEIAIYLSALVGACVGFLWYNSSPAQVFMGDTGSIALGGILGVCAVLLRREFLFALVGGIFVVEALSVILQVASYRLRKGKRIFLCSPLHHHFEYKGWAENKIVIRFWIVGLLLAIVGAASLKIQ